MVFWNVTVGCLDLGCHSWRKGHSGLLWYLLLASSTSCLVLCQDMMALCFLPIFRTHHLKNASQEWPCEPCHYRNTLWCVRWGDQDTGLLDIRAPLDVPCGGTCATILSNLWLIDIISTTALISGIIKVCWIISVSGLDREVSLGLAFWFKVQRVVFIFISVTYKWLTVCPGK